MTLEPAIVPADEAARLCNRTFVSIVAELVACMDRYLGLELTLGRKAAVPAGLTTAADVVRCVEALVEEDYGKIAADKARSSPGKLDWFRGIDSFARAAALSFFALRVPIEHHGARARRDLVLRYWRMKMLSGSKELTRIGEAGEVGEGITLGADHVEKQILAGGAVRLEEADLEHIATTVNLIIGPELARVAKERLART